MRCSSSFIIKIKKEMNSRITVEGKQLHCIPLFLCDKVRKPKIFVFTLNEVPTFDTLELESDAKVFLRTF